MAHILVGGDLNPGSALHSLLQQWGMTSGRYAGEIEGARRPTINECDALILVPPFAGSFDPEPCGPDSAPPAPLLLLGVHPGRVLLARDAQQVVIEPGPDGSLLKPALQACLEQTRQLRGRRDWFGRHEDQDGYLHFLGHELRSPLTAAKTALEVLQGELGGLCQGNPGRPGESTADRKTRLKMLDIALRNIKRLHRTVDWSQDLLELESSAPRNRRSCFPVESLAEVMNPVADFQFASECRGRFLESDPELLRVLAGQLVRVMDIAWPECPLVGAVGLDAEDDSSLELMLRPAGDLCCLEGPRITRTHLTPAAGPCGSSPRQELERLAGYVVSATLLDQLQGRLQVRMDAEGLPALVLQLDLAGGEMIDSQARGDSPAALRAPA